MKHKLLILILLSSFPLVAQIDNIKSQEAIQDLDQFKNIILDYHPEPFRYISEKAWIKQSQDLRDSLSKDENMNILEFFRQITYLGNLIRDEHIQVEIGVYDEAFLFQKSVFLFPFQLRRTNQDTFIIQESLRKSQSHLIGQEITSINGFTTSEICQMIKTLGVANASSDYSGSFYEMFSEYNFSRFFRYFVDDANSYHLKFSKAKPQKVFGYTLYKKLYLEQKTSKKALKQEAQNLKPIFWISEDCSKAYIILPNFYPWDFEQTLGKAKKQMELFFEELNTKKVKSLIIDIRGNEGGSPYYAAHLASFFYSHPFSPFRSLYAKTKAYKEFRGWFKKMGKPHYEQSNTIVRFKKDSIRYIYDKKKFLPFSGEVHILIDEGVSSAASEFTSLMKGHPKVKIYGSESSGDCCTITGQYFKSFLLDNSGLFLTIPLLATKIKEGKYGVKPDVPGIPIHLLPPSEVLKKKVEK